MMTVSQLIEIMQNVQEEHGDIAVNITNPDHNHQVLELEPVALATPGGAAYLVVSEATNNRLDRHSSDLWEYEY